MGDTTTYGYSNIGGRYFVGSIAGSGCASCGGRGNAAFSYDANGNRTSATDALGRTTNYTYDSESNVLSKSIQLNSNTTLTWRYIRRPIQVSGGGRPDHRLHPDGRHCHSEKREGLFGALHRANSDLVSRCRGHLVSVPSQGCRIPGLLALEPHVCDRDGARRPRPERRILMSSSNKRFTTLQHSIRL
jgi:YD repeat-containing protein